MYIIMIGCGRLGSVLAEELSGLGHNVVVIDKNSLALDVLGERFNGITITGDALSLEVLEKAGIKNADVVCSLTGNDNLNIVVAQLVKKMFDVKKVILQIHDSSKEEIVQKGVKIINRSTLFVEEFKKCIL